MTFVFEEFKVKICHCHVWFLPTEGTKADRSIQWCKRRNPLVHHHFPHQNWKIDWFEGYRKYGIYIYISVYIYIYISSVYFIFRHTCMVSFQGMLVCPLYFPFGTCRASAKESFSGNAFCTMIATVSRVAWERVGTLPLPIIIWYYLLSSGLCISQNRLVIYICIVPGPAEVNSEETFSTLQYAKRAGVAKGLQGTPKDPWLLG